MIYRIRSFIEELQIEWEKLLWTSSDEYRASVKERLALHRKAMKEGGTSPYFGDIS